VNRKKENYHVSMENSYVMFKSYNLLINVLYALFYDDYDIHNLS